MTTRFVFPCALALALAACGGADTDPSTTPATGPSGQMGDGDPVPADPAAGEHSHDGAESHAGEGAADHEHHFPAQMTAFHDVMAPLWHADEGEERTAGTCDAIDDFAAKAASLAEAPAPEQVADAAAWDVGTEELIAAVEGLRATCESDRANLQASFTELHDKFHVLVDLLPGGGH